MRNKSPGIRICLLILMSTLLQLGNVATADSAGYKDHPLLTGYPDSHIAEYSQNYDAEKFPVASNEDGTQKQDEYEGDVTRIRYFYNNADNQPSPLQLIRNYQNAIKAIDGEVLYERKPAAGDGGETTLHVIVSGKEYFVRVMPEIYSAPTQSYQLIVLERAAMEQAVEANEMLDQMNAQGFVTLYINFDTNQFEIKQDSRSAITEVAIMLKAAPQLNISIEGHTDNVGEAAANKTLSENRARSVLQALIAEDIATERLSATGFGEEMPIDDNATEAGRANNRRVELVKK